MKTDKEYAKRDTTAVKCACGNIVYVAPNAKLLTPHCPVCGVEVQDLKPYVQVEEAVKPKQEVVKSKQKEKVK